MRMILFSSRQYDNDTFIEANAAHGYELHFQEFPLDSETAILAHGYDVVCPFVSDNVAKMKRGAMLINTVIVTAREAFFTREAMGEIAQTMHANIAAWQAGTPRNVVHAAG